MIKDELKEPIPKPPTHNIIFFTAHHFDNSNKRANSPTCPVILVVKIPKLTKPNTLTIPAANAKSTANNKLCLNVRLKPLECNIANNYINTVDKYKDIKAKVKYDFSLLNKLIVSNAIPKYT